MSKSVTKFLDSQSKEQIKSFLNINEIQPFIRIEKYDCKHSPRHEETLSSRVIGLAIDYVFKYSTTGNKMHACSEIINRANKFKDEDREEFFKLLSKDLQTVDNLINLISFYLRTRTRKKVLKQLYSRKLDEETTKSIFQMVDFINKFLDKEQMEYLGVEQRTSVSGRKNRRNLYICDGSFDLLGKTTIWELKTKSGEPTALEWLQVLIYWMLFVNRFPERRVPKTVALIYPRICTVFKINVLSIPLTIWSKLAEVIGLPWGAKDRIMESLYKLKS